MNVVLRTSMVSGSTSVLGTCMIILSLWFDSTLNGVYDGLRVTSVYGDALGENDIIIQPLIPFLPAAAWPFYRGVRGIFRQEVPA